MNRTFKISILGMAALALGACGTMHKGSDATAGAGAIAQGLGTQAALQGQNYQYRLKAPYNQSYHFAFDRSVVLSAALASIRVQANYLIAHPSARVRLEGNTDERGSREYNVGLGWRRAKAVARVLKEQGVSPSQIVTISYGEERPVAFGHTEAAYRLNRRVDLMYEAK